MSGSKHFDRIALIVTAITLIVTILFMNGTALGLEGTEAALGYENRLFDNTKVHTIDIVMNDWDDMIDNAASEEYYIANLVIDGESYKNVGIRTKGNTSLSTVATLGSERYSFKIEFDHYDSTKTYHGLDKLSLNNLIQDSTMMKDYLTYTMMNAFGVHSSLCSFVYITVNGEDWGLYLAVEGVEEAFLQRNYGSDYGKLYKPDSLSFGGGRGGFGMGSDDVKLQYIDDDLDSYTNIWNSAKTEITEADQARLVESLKKLSAYEDIASVVDVEQVIRYFVVHNYVCNGDSYTGSMIHNYYLYEEDGRLAMIPWDYNLAFGTFTGGDATGTVNTPIDAPVENGSGEDRPMWHWIVENEEYTALYHQYFSEFLSSVDIAGIIDNAYALIKDYVAKDPTAFYSYDEFELGVETLHRFCALRSESISLQLENNETADDMSYVDASNLTLSDMGSMGGGMGGGFTPNMGGGKADFNGSMPDAPGSTSASDEGSGSTMPADFPGEIPDGFDASNLPDGFDPSDMQGGFGGTFPGQGFGDGNGDIPSDDTEGRGETGGKMQWPGGDFSFDMSASSAAASDTAAWISLAVSVVVLALGLLIAKRYKY